MSQSYSNNLARLRRASESLSDQPPAYHDLLRSAVGPYAKAEAEARASVTGRTEAAPTGGRSADTGDQNRVGDMLKSLRAPARVDVLRFQNVRTLAHLADYSRRVWSGGIDRDSPLLARGKIKEPFAGLPLKDGSRAALPGDELNHLASLNFRLAGRLSDRLSLALPESLRAAVRLPDVGDIHEWQNLPQSKRGTYYQKAYELVLALHALEVASPAVFDELTRSSQVLAKLAAGTVEPYTLGFSAQFINRFAVSQAQIAWGWRNMPEPAGGGSAKPDPELTQRDKLFRNQMGVGMLEYLIPLGREALDYMRHFGRVMAESPYRRTEIKEEHMHEFIAGVPLLGDEMLLAPPELTMHVAREHHELWRFVRELSWLLPDQALHQPPRKAHIPFDALSVDVKNRDILNAFGVYFLLSKLPEGDFQQIRQCAASGNPFAFALQEPERVSRPA